MPYIFRLGNMLGIKIQLFHHFHPNGMLLASELIHFYRFKRFHQVVRFRGSCCSIRSDQRILHGVVSIQNRFQRIVS
ncbi:hypothetical protein D3C87_1924400 [compost metagenome]